MSGLWRCHHAFSEVLELLEQQRVEEGAATCVQALKACHQAALDQGSWVLASTLLPWEDPLGRDAFGGDEEEMMAAAAWNGLSACVLICYCRSLSSLYLSSIQTRQTLSRSNRSRYHLQASRSERLSSILVGCPSAME